MTVSIEKSETLAPFIAGLSGITSYAMFALADNNYMNVSVFALYFVGGLLWLLVTLIATPFAIAVLWKGRGRVLRHLSVPSAIKDADWNAVAQTGLSHGGKAGSALSVRMTRLVSHLVHHARELGHMLAQLEWAAFTRNAAWMLANATVTLFPAVFMFFFALAAVNLPARQFDPGLVLLTGLNFLPLVIIAGIAIKTKLDMRRVFTLTPELLFSWGKKTMLVGPFLAVLVVIYATLQLTGVDRGWMILLGPMLAAAVIAQFLFTGGIVMGIGKIVKYRQGRRPPTPPTQGHRGFDDPFLAV